MNKQTLADVLQSTGRTGSYTLVTVLEGPETGSQLLLRDGNAVWQTQNAGLLQRQLAALQDCTATGFLTLDGQRVFAERFGAVPQLVVCGGGHVAAAVVRQAKLLDLPEQIPCSALPLPRRFRMCPAGQRPILRC